MACLDTIECGHEEALKELLFLTDLYVDLSGSADVLSELPMTLGFSDVYRHPALGAEDFIRLVKPSKGLRERISTMRFLTRKLMEPIIEQTTHGDHPRPVGSNVGPAVAMLRT